VVLSRNVPSGGITVLISDNLSDLSVPSTLKVSSGSNAAFTATTGNFKNNESGTITVAYQASSATTNISLTLGSGPGRHAKELPTVTSLTCDQTTLSPGSSTNCIVALSKPADGITIGLRSAGSLLAHPEAVTVTDGSTVSFSLNVQPSANIGAAVITASYDGASRNLPVVISSPKALASLVCNPTVTIGGTVDCLVSVEPGLQRDDLYVQVKTSHPAVRVPAVLKTRSNHTSVPFQCLIDRTAQKGKATITATAGMNTLEQTIDLIPVAGPVLTVPGIQYGRPGDLLRFTVSAEDDGNIPVRVSAQGVPPGAEFDPLTGRFEWVPRDHDEARHTIRFTATNSAGVSAHAKVIVAMDNGKPVIDSLSNGANQSTAMVCRPGSIATVRGRRLAGAIADERSGSVTGLAGSKVMVNGEPVPLLHAAPDHLDFVCPDLPPSAQVSVSAESEFGSADPVALVIAEAAPGIFSLDASGTGQGVVTLAGTHEFATVRDHRMLGQPVQAGDVISVFATGLPPDAHPLIRIDELGAEVLAVTPVPGQMGVWEIRARIPQGIVANDHATMVLQLPKSGNAIQQSNAVTFAVE
jgi:uncharacterized protein (TIGR03437 family)